MSWTGETLRHFYPILCTMPEGTQFSVERSNEITFQAHTLAEVESRKAFFPGQIWKRTWNRRCDWWEYTATLEDGYRVKIWAVHESPPQCKAITETRMVEEQVPVAFETRTVEKEVLVGWDCGNGVKLLP